MQNSMAKTWSICTVMSAAISCAAKKHILRPSIRNKQAKALCVAVVHGNLANTSKDLIAISCVIIASGKTEARCRPSHAVRQTCMPFLVPWGKLKLSVDNIIKATGDGMPEKCMCLNDGADIVLGAKSVHGSSKIGERL